MFSVSRTVYRKWIKVTMKTKKISNQPFLISYSTRRTSRYLTSSSRASSSSAFVKLKILSESIRRQEITKCKKYKMNYAARLIGDRSSSDVITIPKPMIWWRQKKVDVRDRNQNNKVYRRWTFMAFYIWYFCARSIHHLYSIFGKFEFCKGK